MKRFTEVDGKGNWHIAGVEWEKCKGNLYGALCKLKDYEDTGLTPVEIMDGKLFAGWIPVSERLPDTEVEVLVTQKGLMAFMLLQMSGMGMYGSWMIML